MEDTHGLQNADVFTEHVIFEMVLNFVDISEHLN